MRRLKIEIAKFLGSVGFKQYSASLWNAEELNSKISKFGDSDVQSLFLFHESSLSKRLKNSGGEIFNLAEDQLYSCAQQYMDVFGYTIFRQVLENDKIRKIEDILNDLKINSQENKTIYSSPVEYSAEIQEILIDKSLFFKLSKVLGPFWYFGSDAAVNTNAFPLHRDTFFNPPLYKIFIPTQPAIFQVLCGSHHYNDEFSRHAGSYICNWDNPRNLSRGCPSIYFENIDSDTRPIGFDESHKNTMVSNIHLRSGDIFIFNQNLVHGLLPEQKDTTFIAISVFPSPENSKKFKLSRERHLESIIKSTTAITLIEKDLASSKNINSEEVCFPGQLFDKESLEKLTKCRDLTEYFGFSKIPMHVWRSATERYSHLRWEILRDRL